MIMMLTIFVLVSIIVLCGVWDYAALKRELKVRDIDNLDYE
jgi:hypothetical protein